MTRSRLPVAAGMALAALIALGPLQAQPSKPVSSSLYAGQSFQECRNCPEMIVLPPGQITIGSPLNEPLRRENEPQLAISIARPFAMSRMAVTWDQWEACVRDNWCDGVGVETALTTLENGEPNPNYTDYGRGTRPVVGVSWYDAQAFVGWLNYKADEDDAYHLPSDAEWEYGARAGTTTAFPWGPEL
ncbi:MAG: formylglycine-generating enzyme family protein, partial [Gammaproteobacteria bacterium]|nr:formylglycine-generating enzyme family protein [Gammaproteobacteria bacterium]